LALCLFAERSRALVFEIDPALSFHRTETGLSGLGAPQPLSGTISLDVDIDLGMEGATTATLRSVDLVPVGLLDPFQVQLLQLLDVEGPIESNHFALGDSILGYHFQLVGDELILKMDLRSMALLDGPGIILDITATVIPEPSSALLLGLGLGCLGRFGLRRELCMR
jgi:hypothetical protein